MLSLAHLSRFADNRDAESLASWYRRRRSSQLVSYLAERRQDNAALTIADLGGTVDWWLQHAAALERLDVRVVVNLINITHDSLDPHERGNVRVVPVLGDATDLSAIADCTYDVVFSNSVIEHVGTFAQQRKMAREVARIARGFFVQTPNKWFPIEPHFLFPYWQILPSPLRVILVQSFDVGWFRQERSYLVARQLVDQIRLLSAKDMRHLFPNATLRREKFLGLTKSIVAIQ